MKKNDAKELTRKDNLEFRRAALISELKNVDHELGYDEEIEDGISTFENKAELVQFTKEYKKWRKNKKKMEKKNGK